MSGISAEQEARDLMEQCGVEDAQSFSSGDVIALANFIADAHYLRATLEKVRHLAADFTPDPGLADEVIAAVDECLAAAVSVKGPR